ncbi:3-isopropylmalate dehydratase large subunit [Candidatus Sordicultor fermentans]|uniref:3-isopropylmalate dehydratase large subunit n=1 Tax=Candidatus Sordicultor fermentans TaxID=1953203 RepID=UPI0016A72637|nr:3-isopropylmalate dehydratase large subunit [Candidatus Atribacteria bacterium]
MGMTITEKIIAAHAQKEKVIPGELVQVKIDLALANDITAPLGIKELEKQKIDRIFDPDKVVLVADHNTPCKDIASAQNVKLMRDFARKYGISHFFEGGKAGIEHVLLPEEGLIAPGDLVIGADSHTCTYGALGAFSTGMGSTDIAASWVLGETWLRVPESILFLYEGKRKPFVTGKDLILFTIGKIGVDGARYCAMEFRGSVISELSLDERFTMANMAVEAGAKNGIMEADSKVLNYVSGRTSHLSRVYQSDPDARWKEIIEIDVSSLEPQVAFPHLPSNTHSVYSIPKIEIDQVVIGSCTNGRMEDLRMAAQVLKGREVNPRVRLLIFPGTPSVLKQAEKEGLLRIFLEAGGIIAPPSCGPCLGGHLGVLAEGEKCVSTTNRNFLGRMGHVKSEVYLANPYIAASSAVAGYIAAPDQI